MTMMNFGFVASHYILAVSIFVVSVFSQPTFSITLDEAIKSGLGESYVIKEQSEFVKASRFSYISSIDPFCRSSI